MTWYLGEALRGLRSRPGFALVLVLVSAGLTGTALWYANTERVQVRDRASAVEVDGWYLVTFADLAGEPMAAAELDVVCQLDEVAWAAGVLPAEDHTTVGIDRPVTLRGVRGCGLDRIGIPIDPTRAHAAVGLVEDFPFGDVPGIEATSVRGAGGVVTVLQRDGLPLDLLGGASTEGYVVLPPSAVGAPADLLTIRVGVRSLEAAIELARVGPRVLRGDDAASVRVQPSREQYEAQRTYLAGLDRSSAMAVVGIGSVAAAVSSGMLLITTRLRAREYARRRTLGCRRLPLAAQVMVEAMTTTALGAVTGVAALSASALLDVDVVLPVTLLVALPVVMIATTGLLSIPVAVWVGMKDPVLVLRVP